MELVQPRVGRTPPSSNLLGGGKYPEKDQREGDAGNRRNLLGKKVRRRYPQKRQSDQAQAHGNLESANVQIQRHAKSPRPGLLEPEHQHGQALGDEAPQHAEGIGLAQHVNVAAAQQDREQLEPHHKVNDPVSGPKAAVRLTEPVRQDSVF